MAKGTEAKERLRKERHSTVRYEPLSETDWENPYPRYRELRDHAPLHWAPETGCWCISRYDDALFALKNPELFSSHAAFDILIEDRIRSFRLRDVPEFVRFLARMRINPVTAWRRPPEMLIALDPPRHDALRSIVNRGFTPRRIDAWEDRMREIARECMSGLARGEPFDVVRDLAIPLPVTVIAELLGIAAEDHALFKHWSDELVTGSTGSLRHEPISRYLRKMGEFRKYMRPIIRARRSNPTNDLISVLVDPSRDDSLSEHAAFEFLLLLLVAGNETTTNLIGNAACALIDHPDQLALVRADPGLIPALVEEVLRFDGPVQYVFRKATRDIPMHDQVIREGDSVAVLLGSANRDERRFDDPDSFDVTRPSRGHLAFGVGVHFCLGSSVARMEARVALDALVPELARLTPAESERKLVDSYMVRGPERIELVAIEASG